MTIEHIDVDDVEAIAKVNASIDKANQVDNKSADADVVMSLARPGESGDFFTATIDGAPSALAPISGKVTHSADGKVLQVTAAGIVASRGAVRVEPGRALTLRYVVRRTTNPTDPAGDAVRLGIRWLDASFAGVSSSVALDLLSLPVGSGRAERTVTIATTAGDGIDIVAPGGAVYARLFVQTFGSDGVTNVEVIEATDITDINNVAGDVASLDLQFGPLISGVYDDLKDAVQLLNGATSMTNVDGRKLGFQIPIGQTGYQTVAQYLISIEPSVAPFLFGCVVEVTMVFATSNAYAKTVLPGVDYVTQTGTLVHNDIDVTRNEQLSGIFRIVTFTTELPNNVATLLPYILQDTNSAAVALEYMLLSDMRLRIAANTSEIRTINLDNAVQSFAGVRRALTPDIGPIFLDLTTIGQMHNGATYRFRDDVVVGWTIPIGNTGDDSYVQANLRLSSEEIALAVGSALEWQLLLQHSDGYSRTIDFRVLNDAGIVGTQLVRYERVAPGYTVIAARFVVPVDTTHLSYYFQSNGGSAAIAEEWVEHIDAALRVITPVSLLRTAAQLASHWADMRTRRRASASLQAADDALDGLRPAADIVAITSTATSIETTIAAGHAPTKDARRRITVAAGNYTETSIAGRAYSDIVGEDRDRVVVDGSQPADSSLDDIALFSVFEWYWHGDMSGITAIGENCRYVVHLDNVTRPPDTSWRISDCVLIHRGNEAARAYQTSIGQDPDAVWVSTHALGIGVNSGYRLTVKDTACIGWRAGVAMHNSPVPTEKAAHIHFENCTLGGRSSSAFSMDVQNIGSGKADTIDVIGCTLLGDINYGTGLWNPTTLAYQPADHSEFQLSGFGNSPAVFKVTDFGRALKIESAATSGTSTIAVSGTAVALLFGSVVSKPGAGGIKGYAYGSFDISGHLVGPSSNLAITGLGKRLGDCSSVHKTLTVSVDGGAGIDVVFSADYTASSNATILGLINTALSAGATASEYAIGERYRPAFRDEERLLLNATATGIPMGAACAYDSDSSRKVRVMTNADAASLFAGIAWEDIYPGELGRVKNAGFLPLTDLARGDAATFAIGDKLSVGSTAGQLVKSASAPVLTAIRSDAVRFG